jgi:hypothetical protein
VLSTASWPENVSCGDCSRVVDKVLKAGLSLRGKRLKMSGSIKSEEVLMECVIERVGARSL